MNVKKVVISVLILYTLVFLLTIVSTFIVKMDVVMFGTAMLVIEPVLIFLIAKYYFKELKVKNPVKDGLMLGLILVIGVTVMDIPIIMSGVISEQAGLFTGIENGGIIFNLAYIFMLIVPIVAAYNKKK